MNRFEQFKQSYVDAIEHIEYEKNNKERPDMAVITQWLLETDVNPYSFLANGDVLSSAEGFSSLLHKISHALYDDGDISFVTVDDEPRIVFMDYEETEQERVSVLRQIEIENEKNGLCRYEICKLKSVKEFIEAFEHFNIKYEKLVFENDIWSDGLAAAIEKHQNNKYFNKDWIPLEKESCLKVNY